MFPEDPQRLSGVVFLPKVTEDSPGLPARKCSAYLLSYSHHFFFIFQYFTHLAGPGLPMCTVSLPLKTKHLDINMISQTRQTRQKVKQTSAKTNFWSNHSQNFI